MNNKIGFLTNLMIFLINILKIQLKRHTKGFNLISNILLINWRHLMLDSSWEVSIIVTLKAQE